MSMNKILGGVFLSLSFACGPSEQAKTVTHTDTTTTGTAGNTETKTSDTQVTSSDGSKETTRTEDTKQQPAKK